MNKTIREVYGELYRMRRNVPQAYVEPAFSGYGESAKASNAAVDTLPDEISKSIDTVAEKVSKDLNKELRPDAKLLLLVNFSDLVVAPLVSAGTASLEKIRSAVEQDIALLIKDAAQRKDKKEISGHDIIDALAKRWATLAISVFDLWE